MPYMYCHWCNAGVEEPSLVDRLCGETSCPRCHRDIDIMRERRLAVSELVARLEKLEGSKSMQSAYYTELKNPARLAVVDLMPYEGGYLITRINVPREHRGRGVARSLLRRVLADADAGGVTLYLEVSPSDGLDYRELCGWYGRHGFEFEDKLWARRPVRRG